MSVDSPFARLQIGDTGHVVIRQAPDSEPVAVELVRDPTSSRSGGTFRIELSGREIARYILGKDFLAASRLESSGTLEARFGPIGHVAWKLPSAADLALPFISRCDSPAALYPFQHDGVSRLTSSDRVLLADDMGLGKSVQLACALLVESQRTLGFHSLLVAPVTLLSNWMEELRRWAPLLVAMRARDLRSPDHCRRSHVLLMSFEEMSTVSRSVLPEWDVVVVDEAHRLRNVDSLRSKAFRQVRQKKLWLATGTPIENRPDDLAVLLQVLEPHRFSSSRLAGSPQAIRGAAREFTIRRTKSEVLGDLPQLLNVEVPVILGSPQQREYDRVETGRGIVPKHQFERIAQLRQICDHFEAHSTKIDWLCAHLQGLPKDEKVIAFSSHLGVLHLARSRLPQSELLSGDVDPDERTRIVRAFQEDTGPRVLLLSQRVGAEGITLTRANHVVFINEWWNPSATSQALDRVRRIGQHRPTFCYRLFAPGTIEDRVRQLLRDKSAEAEQVLEYLSGPLCFQGELD